MDLLNLVRLKRENQRGFSRSNFSDVTQMSSGGLRAVGVVVENSDCVALPLDEFCISGLAIRAMMVFSATSPAPHAELFERVIRGEGSFATTSSRRTTTMGLRASKKSRDWRYGVVHDRRRCVQVVCLAHNLL
jgi:hypothetical protein